MTSEDTPKSISSPALEDGHTHSGSQVGMTFDLYGRPVVPVLPSARQAKRRGALSARARVLCGALDELATQYAQTASTHGLPMPATYGLKFGGFQPSVALNYSLGNRLWKLSEHPGSLLYELRWKSSVTLLGLEDYLLQALEHRTSATDVSGWHSPTSGDSRRRTYQYDGGDRTKPRLSNEGLVSGWPTPLAKDDNKSPEAHLAMKERMGGNRTAITSLQVLAKGLAPWPTPMVPNGGRSIKHAEVKGGTLYHKGTKVQMGLEGAVRLSGWATPRSVESGHTTGSPARAANPRGRLEDQVAGWATPAARDGKSESATQEFNEKRDGESRGKPLSYQATLTPTEDSDSTPGTDLSSSPASMEDGALSHLLNPIFSQWLQGFPLEWVASAPGYEDWQKWQTLMGPLSREQKHSVLECSGPTEIR